MGGEMGRSASEQEIFRVVAVPLVTKGETSTRALLAVFCVADASLSALERVETRAKLAVAVLSAEREREAAVTNKQREKSLLEASRDAIVLLNATGEPIASNCAARTLLLAPWGQAEENRAAGDDSLRGGTRFTDYFRARDREKVTAWLQRAVGSLRDRETDSPEFELECGARARLQTREVEPGRLVVMLLPSVNADRAAEQTRAEAELLGLSEWLDQGVLIFDAEENIQLMNVRFAQLAGLAPNEMDRLKTLGALSARLRDHSAE